MPMPKKPRALCAHCEQRPARFAKCRYCSRDCYAAAQRAQALARRALCLVCPQPVKDRRCRYCSLACKGAAERTAALARRPVCEWCQEKPTPKPSARFCSKSCATLARAQDPAFRRAQRAGWDKASATLRQQYFERIRRRFEDCFRPVFDAHPEWSAETRLEILRAAVPVWRRAYNNAWQARGTRERRAS